MGIISTIGRKHWSVRSLLFIIYAGLISGAVTMVYPFMLMIAGSTKSAVDNRDAAIVPAYLRNRTALYQKSMEAFFNESLEAMRTVYQRNVPSFDRLQLPGTPMDMPERRLLQAWDEAVARAEAGDNLKAIGKQLNAEERELGVRWDLPMRDRQPDDPAILAELRKVRTELAAELAVAMRKQGWPPDAVDQLPAPNPKLADAWAQWCTDTDLPVYSYTLGFWEAKISSQAVPSNLREFKAELSKRYDDSVDEMNRALQTNWISWNSVFPQREDFMFRRNMPQADPWSKAFGDFKARQPIWERYYFSMEGYYKVGYLMVQYGKDIAGYNGTHGTDYASWDQVHLDRSYPGDAGRADKEREDWEYFVRNIANLLWLRAVPAATPAYRDFLEAKYETIAAYNRNYGTTYAAFADVPLPTDCPADGLPLSDWDSFCQGWKNPLTGKMYILPIEHVRIHSIDFMWRDHLIQEYGDVAGVNAAFGTRYPDIMTVQPPQLDLHYQAFTERIGSLRWEFTVRNFLTVISYIVLHGRGIFNTFVYCFLAIGSALIVNPLAAYALSRYRPPNAYKILLFLMLTMAFPPMVTQIPTFLMLREFHLLNTFAALVLPGLANGYSIFLLKGFFDSLPQELYESAAIDGAGEFRIFWQITMSLSTPILAVIALTAFTRSYANFIMALLICQDEKMWTLMPWLYQLQQRSCEGVVFASLLIAAIPTFLVFAFAQNVIMRGIVVPVEK